MQLCSTLCGTGRERSVGENWYTYMYGQGPSLFTWNCHIINQLYPNTKEKVQKKKKIGVYLTKKNKILSGRKKARLVVFLQGWDQA